jgi:hypothetical protein
MNETEIESQLQAKGLNAPRLTPEDIRQSIVDEFYFTAADGIETTTGIPRTSIDLPAGVKTLTFCVLVLRNGAKVVGINYGPVSAANFDVDIARTQAKAAAVEQVWMLEGYLLKQRLHDNA